MCLCCVNRHRPLNSCDESRARQSPHRTESGEKVMIRIITIEREFGCGAGGIARELAARLGWKLWDQRLSEEIARLAHCKRCDVQQREERRDPLYYRLLKSFTLGSYEGNASVSRVEALDADSIVKLSDRVVTQAAEAGECVIVGRGSQHFLRDRDDTLRFFLYGSKTKKVRRLISEGQDEADARFLVDTVDRERAAFIKNYFHAEWPNRSVYHAMINTDAGAETVIQAMLSFLERKRPLHSSSERRDELSLPGQ
jgi:cytidylate kinase